MRQIKFRVIRNNKVFGYERLVEKDGTTHWEWMSLELNPENKENWYVGTFHNSYDYKRQQFTGLHDKNGVEIYEGDVVRSETYNMDKKEVRWSYTYWSPFLYYMSSVEEDFEVIDNIYENPELLKHERN